MLVETPSDAALAETSQTTAEAATGEQPAAGADTAAATAIPAEQREPAEVPHTGTETTAAEPAVSDAVPGEKGTAATGVSAGRP